jgi:hypothetical protein
MDVVVAVVLGGVVATTSLLMEARQVVGLLAALLAALLAGHLGWHGTDRLIAWRQRPDED